MGRSIKPKYRIILDNAPAMGWKGPANDKLLAEWIRAYGKSLEMGGSNVHISLGLGYIPYPNKARIETNVRSYPTIVATWQAGMFQVWS
jgi:hypothetical protein